MGLSEAPQGKTETVLWDHTFLFFGLSCAPRLYVMYRTFARDQVGYSDMELVHMVQNIESNIIYGRARKSRGRRRIPQFDNLGS